MSDLQLNHTTGTLYSPWQTRIEAANKVHGEWEGKFKCKLLEDYYEGFQWKQRRDYPTTNYNPYTLNLIYSTIKIKLASLVFQKPKFLVSPTPGNSQWNMDFAVKSAQLKEDVLNTIVSNPNTNFAKHVKRAIRDSFFRFAILEVGHAADWRNPQKTDPQLKSWDDVDVNIEDDKIVEDNMVPINERFYVKRIRPQRFRVSVSESIDLNDHDWVGYFEYYYTRTLMHTKGIKWPENYASSNSYVSAEYANGFVGADKEDLFKQLYLAGEISRCWHIWDIVSHKRLLLLEDNEMSELWSGPFDHLPLIDLRWDERSSGFYPIPPVFQWLSPQDEINEAREQTRSYRRRFTRKFQSVKGSVDEEEKEKFASGPDGIIVEVKQQGAISPIDNPEQGPTAENALILAKDDFNIVSGTSAEARGQDSDRETATQAKIVDVRSQIRESSEQLDCATFIASIGRELLVQAQHGLETGLWVKYSSNAGSEIDPAQQGQPTVDPLLYQYITSQQIDDGYDFEVQFDVQNATPAAMQAAQQAFVNFMSLLANFPLISMDPILIREAAMRVGYRNEAVIEKAQKAAQAAMMAKMQQEMNPPAAGGGANAGKAQAAQMQTPSHAQIGNQLQHQLQ
jgi:hypothetical protein